MFFYYNKKNNTLTACENDLDFGEDVIKIQEEEGGVLWSGLKQGKSLGVCSVSGSPVLVDGEAMPIEQIQKQIREETNDLLLDFLREKFKDDPGLAEVNSKIEEIKSKQLK